jgi:hypothetical protein
VTGDEETPTGQVDTGELTVTRGVTGVTRDDGGGGLETKNRGDLTRSKGGDRDPRGEGGLGKTDRNRLDSGLGHCVNPQVDVWGPPPHTRDCTGDMYSGQGENHWVE